MEEAHKRIIAFLDSLDFLNRTDAELLLGGGWDLLVYESNFSILRDKAEMRFLNVNSDHATTILDFCLREGLLQQQPLDGMLSKLAVRIFTANEHAAHLREYGKKVVTNVTN